MIDVLVLRWVPFVLAHTILAMCAVGLAIHAAVVHAHASWRQRTKADASLSQKTRAPERAAASKAASAPSTSPQPELVVWRSASRLSCDSALASPSAGSLPSAEAPSALASARASGESRSAEASSHGKDESARSPTQVEVWVAEGR